MVIMEDMVVYLLSYSLQMWCMGSGNFERIFVILCLYAKHFPIFESMTTCCLDLLLAVVCTLPRPQKFYLFSRYRIYPN